jgi:hypothetical protein
MRTGVEMDTINAGEKIAAMWLFLAEQAALFAHDHVKAGAFEDAAKAGRYCEAFYWRATGESDAIDLATDKLP